MRRTGVIVPHAIRPRELPAFAREIADLGYTDFWSGESDRVDGITPLALAVAADDRLAVGTAIVPVFTRGRALLAQTVASLASAAPGRVTFGIGASSPWIVTGWNAIEFRDPLSRVRETARYLRRALAGEKVEGGFRLGLVPEVVPSIAIGALQPQMLRVAGQEGDGVVFTSLSARDVPRLLTQVQPQREHFRVIAWVTVCVVDDDASFTDAFTLARRRAGRYLLTPTYARYHRWLGRGDLLDAMGTDVDDAPDQLIRDIVVIGTITECRQQLDEFFAAGVDTVLLEIMPGIGDLRRTIEALAPTH